VFCFSFISVNKIRPISFDLCAYKQKDDTSSKGNQQYSPIEINKQKNQSLKTKKTGQYISESIDSLEKQVSWKYGNSVSNFEEEEENEKEIIASIKPLPKSRGPNTVKYFQRKLIGAPVDKATSVKLSSIKLNQNDQNSPKVIDDIVDSDSDNFGEDEDDDYDFDHKIDLSSTAKESYRLRPPAPVNPELIKAQENKLKIAQEKDLAKKEKIALKRTLEKTQFQKFEFDSIDFFNKNSSLEIFSTKTFSEIGVTNTIALKNLENMAIFSPTKIQESTIPMLQSGKDLLIQVTTHFLCNYTSIILFSLNLYINPNIFKF
jgi:hypothetical protein